MSLEYLAINFGIGAILALSLNIEVGFTGIPQFGRVMAALVGALAAGGLMSRIAAAIFGLPWGAEYAENSARYATVINSALAVNPLTAVALLLVTLILAIVLGAIVGYATAFPALRLREAYLGITLLSFGEILRSILYNYTPLIGGTKGLSIPDVFRFLHGFRSQSAIIFILFVVILMLAIAERINRSPLGRVMKAVRDSELAAEVYGKDIGNIRAYALIIGSAMASVAGALYALFTQTIYAYQFSRYEFTFLPWAYIMLGGVGNNIGVVLGTLLFSSARMIIVIYKYEISAVIPVDPVWLEYLLTGVVLVLVTKFRPKGLLPERPAFTLSRRAIESISRKAGSSG
ncbi:MAG: branched-chain amino acid ABC transporter permease [Ignisphaera sp.]|nr:branched-chain amino acid ABC transporter permease [Ignisphaera sp.]MCX8167584.1 branched-chain amino acid ABC transporter permease [Ignisphaera sp.]MDW8085404.1 branched-chain amino acid ABC transporter permease [Ignisphaera sp.]